MRLYIAGPMRGIAAYNFPAFEAAAAALELGGYEVFSPARRDLADGFDPTGMNGHENLAEHGFNLREALRIDLVWICDHADGIALLDGWHASLGATAEHATATALSLPCKTVARWLDEARWRGR